MKRLFAVILALTMILTGTCGFAYADERPESVTSEGRIRFLTPEKYEQVKFENGKAILLWGNVDHFIYDMNWTETGLDTYLLVDIDNFEGFSNGSRVSAVILTEDNIQSLRIFDGNTQVANDGLITFREDGMASISREFMNKGYSLFIEADGSDTLYHHINQMMLSTGYGKSKISQTPNCWYLDYDDIPARAEDGSKIVYCLLPKISHKEQPAYADAYSNTGTPDIQLTGEVKSSNGYWVYPAKIPANFDKTITLIFEYGRSSTEHARLFFYINPGTETPADLPDSTAEPIDPEKALERAKFIVKTSKVSSGTRVKYTLRGVDLEGLQEAGYTLKMKYYRSTKKSSGYKLQGTRDLEKTYTNTKGTDGKKYYYKVRLAVYDENGKLAAQTALKQSPSAARTFKK